MVQLFLQAAPVHSPHDAGVRQVAALSARLAYVLMCLTLCWGVFVSTGWVHKLSGRQATRSSHMVFATLALAFGGLHAASFLFLTDQHFSALMLTVPIVDGGQLRWAAGIIGFELMVAIAISTGLQRFFAYRRWLWLHRLAYVAVGLLVIHSLFGAIANGHLEILWLGGLTVLVPTIVLGAVRFVPPRLLTGAGLVEEEA
ncbi:MAG TPA: ferric reductase-like transmembrane domain-containing protein [Pseudonocardiaceae bacterium]|jgi:sulfoxide reductase heme-binding subunit YedZ|nr:ferric reductase-like transmembrane domain-containing protein [Pseudonocardiaceae bacterium]